MYNEKIDENLIKNVEMAIYNNEFFDYLIGTGKYKFTVNGQSYSEKRNDMIIMVKGIELYRIKTKTNIEQYITQQLMMFSKSNDIDKVFTALDFVKEFIYLKKTNQIGFSIEILPILENLKNALVEHKNDMINNKKDDFNREKGMWSFVENDSQFIEKYTGHKIL